MRSPTSAGSDPSRPGSPNGPLCVPWWRPRWLCAGHPSRSQDGCDGSFLVTPPCRSRTKRSTSRSTTLAGAKQSTAASPSDCGQPGPCAARRSPMRPTGRGIIRGMVCITDRPAEVEDRKVPGHWEGDLVMGTRPSAVATLVERTSRYTAIVALPDGIKAEQVAPHLTRSLLGIPPQLRRTLTWDRDREMATRPSPPRPGCRSTSASCAVRGSAAPTRTPTGC